MNDPRTEISFAPPILLSRAAELAALNEHGVVDVTPDTVTWLKRSVKSLIECLGDVDVSTVAARDIDRWKKDHIKRGTKPVTLNTQLRGLKTMWSRLQRNRTVGHNPAAGVKFLPEPRGGPKAVSRKTYQAMRKVANVRDRAIIDTFWGTGCRIGGLISMDLDKIDRWESEDGLCFALLVTEKGQKQRYVYLKGREAHSVQGWIEERPHANSMALFTTRQGTRFTRVGLSHVMRRLRLDAGIGKGTPASAHAFRHAFAIRMLDKGYDLGTVSQWLGHHSPEFTASVYCIRSEEQLRKRYFRDP